MKKGCYEALQTSGSQPVSSVGRNCLTVFFFQAYTSYIYHTNSIIPYPNQEINTKIKKNFKKSIDFSLFMLYNTATIDMNCVKNAATFRVSVSNTAKLLFCIMT